MRISVNFFLSLLFILAIQTTSILSDTEEEIAAAKIKAAKIKEITDIVELYKTEENEEEAFEQKKAPLLKKINQLHEAREGAEERLAQARKAGIAPDVRKIRKEIREIKQESNRIESQIDEIDDQLDVVHEKYKKKYSVEAIQWKALRRHVRTEVEEIKEEIEEIEAPAKPPPVAPEPAPLPPMEPVYPAPMEPAPLPPMKPLPVLEPVAPMEPVPPVPMKPIPVLEPVAPMEPIPPVPMEPIPVKEPTEVEDEDFEPPAEPLEVKEEPFEPPAEEEEPEEEIIAKPPPKRPLRVGRVTFGMKPEDVPTGELSGGAAMGMSPESAGALGYKEEVEAEEAEEAEEEAPAAIVPEYTIDAPIPTAPGVQPGVQPGIQPGMQPGVQPGMEPGVQPGMEPGMEPVAEPGAAFASSQEFNEAFDAAANSPMPIEGLKAMVPRMGAGVTPVNLSLFVGTLLTIPRWIIASGKGRPKPLGAFVKGKKGKMMLPPTKLINIPSQFYLLTNAYADLLAAAKDHSSVGGANPSYGQRLTQAWNKYRPLNLKLELKEATKGLRTVMQMRLKGATPVNLLPLIMSRISKVVDKMNSFNVTKTSEGNYFLKKLKTVYKNLIKSKMFPDIDASPLGPVVKTFEVLVAKMLRPQHPIRLMSSGGGRKAKKMRTIIKQIKGLRTDMELQYANKKGMKTAEALKLKATLYKKTLERIYPEAAKAGTAASAAVPAAGPAA